MVLVGVYLYSAIWSLIPFFGIAGYDVEPFGLSCTLDWKTTHPSIVLYSLVHSQDGNCEVANRLNIEFNCWRQDDFLPLIEWNLIHFYFFSLGGRWYIISLCVFCIFLPALVIFGSHLAVFFQIRRMRSVQHCTRISRQSLKAETQFFRVSLFIPLTETVCLILTCVLHWQVSFGVCFGFLFAWFPYTCLALYSIFGDSSHIPMWLTAVPVLMAKSSIAYNPIIYVVITKSYRYNAISTTQYLTGSINIIGNQKWLHPSGSWHVSSSWL